MMPVDLVIVPKNMKNGIGQRYVQLLHQTEKYRTVTSKQCNGDKFKQDWDEEMFMFIHRPGISGHHKKPYF